jgi:hypothetical protein
MPTVMLKRLYLHVDAQVVADMTLLQYKTVLQTSNDREQVRQSFQCFLGELVVPTQLS